MCDTTQMLKRESAPSRQSGAISLPVLGYPSGLTVTSVAKPGDAAGSSAPKTKSSSQSSSSQRQQLKSGGGTSRGEKGHALDEGNDNKGGASHPANGGEKGKDSGIGAAEVDTRDSRTALGDDEGNLDYLSAEAFCQRALVLRSDTWGLDTMTKETKGVIEMLLAIYKAQHHERQAEAHELECFPERHVARLRGIAHELDESVEFFLLERRRVMLRRRAKSAVYQPTIVGRQGKHGGRDGGGGRRGSLVHRRRIAADQARASSPSPMDDADADAAAEGRRGTSGTGGGGGTGTGGGGEGGRGGGGGSSKDGGEDDDEDDDDVDRRRGARSSAVGGAAAAKAAQAGRNRMMRDVDRAARTSTRLLLGLPRDGQPEGNDNNDDNFGGSSPAAAVGAGHDGLAAMLEAMGVRGTAADTHDGRRDSRASFDDEHDHDEDDVLAAPTRGLERAQQKKNKTTTTKKSIAFTTLSGGGGGGDDKTTAKKSIAFTTLSGGGGGGDGGGGGGEGVDGVAPPLPLPLHCPTHGARGGVGGGEKDDSGGHGDGMGSLGDGWHTSNRLSAHAATFRALVHAALANMEAEACAEGRQADVRARSGGDSAMRGGVPTTYGGGERSLVRALLERSDWHTAANGCLAALERDGSDAMAKRTLRVALEELRRYPKLDDFKAHATLQLASSGTAGISATVAAAAHAAATGLGSVMSMALAQRGAAHPALGQNAARRARHLRMMCHIRIWSLNN